MNLSEKQCPEFMFLTNPVALVMSSCLMSVVVVLATGCQQRMYVGGVGGNTVNVMRYDGSVEVMPVDEYWKTPEYRYSQRHPEELQAMLRAALDDYKKEQAAGATGGLSASVNGAIDVR